MNEPEDQVQPHKVFKGHSRTIWGVTITPDGRSVVSASRDKTIKVWLLDSGKCSATIRGHSGDVDEVKVTSDGLRLISSSDDGTVRVWDLATGKCLSILGKESNQLSLRPSFTGMAITPDGKRIVVGYIDSYYFGRRFEIFEQGENKSSTQ